MRRIFTLLVLSLLVTVDGFGQNHVNYDRDSRWFIGLNGGATWTTQTEVPYVFRGGYGLTIGKSIGMEPDKIFSWDLRARFLHAWVQGQSTNRYTLDSTTTGSLGHYGNTLNTYQDSLGYFIPNYRTHLLRGSLELVLNTNRLRQNTGWNLYAFGGVGITGYHTKTDLVDNDFSLIDGPIYDYDQLNSTTVSNLNTIQDGDFETSLVGDDFDMEVDWMPSFGFGISKQVAPGIALGLEHKMTWTRTNTFDGMPNNFDGTPSTINDKYHYTSLTAKFHLFGGKRTDYPVEDPKDDDVNVDDFDTNDDPVVIDEPVTKKKPIVDIYDPNTSPYTTDQGTFRIKANIYYVEGRSDVTFKQDGNINTNFTFNPTTNRFESNVVLHPGQNLFEITGVNEAGSDYESVIIIYEKEEEPLNPPIVTITNPPYTPYYTSSDIFGLVSTVLNVDSKAQIQVYLNGVNLNAFSYDLTSKVLNSSLNLIEGTNTVTVTATNTVGSDSKTVQIIYEKPEEQQPPIVSFVNPGVDPYYTNVNAITVRATALHVEKKSDLTVKVNGNTITGFSFNTSTKEIYFNTGLIEGANILEITGVNSAGSDMATTTIIYTRPETPQPPIVTFIDPEVDPITVYTPSYNVTAKVEHVASASDITLRINGVVTTMFTYSISSDMMNFTTSLVEGSNVIEIKGVNEYGEDIETTTIIYKRTIPQAPPIVNITYPAVDNQVFESPDITLSATVLNVSSAANINVLVNGVVTYGFSYNIYTKELILPMVLVEGSNVVQITGTNAAGSDSETRVIIYERPKVPSPPTVNFVNPPSSPHLVDAAPYTVTAHTTHIDSKAQIVLKHNGELISNASYSFVAGHQIIYNATLIPGSNIFEVVVTNPDGSASDLAVVNYEIDDEPCIIPTVGYISPVPYSTVEDPNVMIDAQINNHSPGTLVELKLNGVSQGYMTFNAATSIASKAATLNEGSNAVTVIVTNECGTNQATFTLNYEAPDAPCPEPTLTTAESTSFTTLEENVSLTLTAANVSEAAEISVKLNGTSIPFAYDAGTGAVTISGIGLAIGNNAIVVTANTDCGSAVVVFNITREECKLPAISSIVPENGTTTEDESLVLTASITNVTSDEIVLLVNGVSHEFSYNAATNTLSEAIGLNVGANVITITATNACGSDSKTIRVTREIPCQTIITNLLIPASNTVTSTENTFDITLHSAGLTGPEQITATLNGTTVAHSFDPVSGNIVLAGLSLNDGENTVRIEMENECSKDAVEYTISYEGCKPPVVIMNSITPDMVVNDGIFILSAIVTNISNPDDITVNVNGSPVDFDFDPVGHVLTSTFPLVEGINSIDIIANGCETASATGAVTYEIPCDKITHSLMSPTSTTLTVVESDFNLSLSTFGIESAEQIEVTLNGTNIPFAYNEETKIITVNGITLIDGANTIIVSMQNECSSDLVNYTVNYNGCKPPVITFGAMSNSVTDAVFAFEANVSNIDSPEGIMLLLNSAPVPFVFNPASGSLEAELTLTEGTNTISVVANGCEKAEQDFSVTYTVPCLPITYTLGHPEKLSVEVADPTYSISLIAQHVTAEGITVTNNGSTIPFTIADNILSINGIVLADGTNTILVTLTNDCSRETITYTIEHNDCNTPEMDLSGNALAVESAGYSFVATVTNVETDEQVQLKVNGVLVPSTLDPASLLVTSFFTLNEGSNTIELILNGCASATGSITVTYTVPCSPVTYALVSPASLMSTSTDGVISISLNTTDVSEGMPITATLNGTTVPHTFTGGVIALTGLTLAEGSNVITVSFGNECSSETVNYTVQYEPCVVPRINLTGGIADGMEVTEEELRLFAQVFDVADAGDLVVKLNGVAVPHEFDPASIMLQVPLMLVEGSNTIEIIVEGCERVVESLTVVYNPPCLAPTYTMVSPTDTDVTIEAESGSSYTITLNTANVTEDQVNVKVNGRDVPFTFSDGTVIFDVTYVSVPGNAADVTLTNDCGTVSLRYVITFQPAPVDCKPEVSASFGEENRSVTVNSDIDLINVVLNLDDGSNQVITKVTGKGGTFSPTGDKKDRCIVGVWVRSGCNVSDAGEPFGDYVANPKWKGICEEPCSPVSYTLVTPNRLNLSTTASPYSIVFNAKNIENATGVQAMVNGVKMNVALSGERVSLKGIKLKKGTNSIVFTISNACSSRKVKYTVTYNPPVQQNLGSGDNKGTGNVIGQVKATPVITPISPSSARSTVNSQTLSLKTKVLNVSSKAEIEVIVNSNKFTGFNYSTSTKQVSAVIRLNEGVNMIKIKANNGKTAEFTYYITYKKPSSGGNVVTQKVTPTPKFEHVNPRSSSANTTSSTYTVKVKALNVMSKSNIVLTVNGTRVTNFTFSSSTKLVTATVRLKQGSNTIRFEATNNGKKASVNYTITYKPAQNNNTGQINNTDKTGGGNVTQAVTKKPEFKMISPTATTKTVKSQTFTLKVKVLNVRSKADIKLMLNGAYVRGFTYNATTKELIATLSLKTGKNTIKVIANNGKQSATINYTITYQGAVNGNLKMNNGTGTKNGSNNRIGG